MTSRWPTGPTLIDAAGVALGTVTDPLRVREVVDGATPSYATLGSTGAGSGTTNAVGNYSVTPLVIYYQAPAGGVRIDRVMLSIYDGATFVAGTLGNITLTNGFLIQRIAADTTTVLATYATVLNNGSLPTTVGARVVQMGGGSSFAQIQTWEPTGGIRLEAGQRLRVTYRDNHTGLDALLVGVETSPLPGA